MYPTVVIVGRPNVGKSTLFNRLTHSRDALVADLPGLTRDRHYAPARTGRKPFLVVDTGGFEPVAEHGILHEMGKQTLQAIAEADVVVFLLDYRQGLMAQDTAIAEKLRQEAARVIVAVNKAEGIDPASACAEFHELGLGNPVAISAAHGSGVQALLAQLEQRLPTAEPEVSEDDHPRIAVVGRPNVGKSSLLNRLLGEERVVVFDQPGTTRDSIAVTFERRGKRYTLVDTAGIRRRGKVFEAIEKFSVVKTLQAISSANVVLLVMDAIEQISEQDARIAGFVLEQGKAVVIAVNKWDAVDKEQRELVKREVTRKLGFLNFARFHYISAVSGAGTEKLLDSVDDAYQAAMVKLSTPKLTRTLLAATSRHQPPHAGRSRPKLRYAHQGGSNPPIVVIHGNALRSVPDSYRRYLENVFRDTFSLEGTPLRIQFKQSTNPYASKAR